MDPIQVDLIPIGHPFTEEELRDRMAQGWHIAGQVMVAKGGGLVTPDNPEGKANVMPCNIWIINRMMVPADLVGRAVLQSESRDQLCQALFNMPLAQLEESLGA